MGKRVTSKFVLKGDNQLNSAFSQAKRQVGNIATAAGLAGTALAGMFARSVIQKTIEQEQAVAQLNAALKSTGKYTPEASQAIQDHASTLQQMSTYGDEAIIKAQNLLLTFRNIGDETFPRATQAVLDTATAMGTDLKSASIQLGKALNDPKTQLSALSRSGITFSQQQKDMVAAMVDANNMAGAQAIILKELETQFGGSAEAARNTLGGALDAVKNNFGDLLEVSGDGTSGVIGSLNELADTLARPEVQEGFQNLAQDSLELLAALAQLPGTFGFLADEVQAFFGVIDEADTYRKMEEIHDLEEQLQTAREKSTNIFGMENSMWQSRATSLEREIALKKELLEADALFPEIKVTAERSKPNFNQDNPDQKPGILDPESESRNAQAITATIEKMMMDVKTFGMSDDERALVQLIDQGATEEQIALIKQAQDEMRILKEQQEIANATLEEIVVSAQRVKPNFDDLETSSEKIGGSLESAGKSAFDAWVNGSKSAKEAFADMAKDMLKQLAALIIKQAILSALGGSYSSTSTSLGSLFGGTRDSGGPGDPGKAYMIGTGAQPEMFIPNTPGTFIPNADRLGGSSSVTVNIDARQNDDPGRLLALVPVIQEQIETSIALKQRRGYL